MVCLAKKLTHLFEVCHGKAWSLGPAESIILFIKSVAKVERKGVMEIQVASSGLLLEVDCGGPLLAPHLESLL